MHAGGSALSWHGGEKQGHNGNFLGLMWHSLCSSLLSLHLGEAPKPTPLSLHFLHHPHGTLEANGVTLRLSSSTTVPPQNQIGPKCLNNNNI